MQRMGVYIKVLQFLITLSFWCSPGCLCWVMLAQWIDSVKLWNDRKKALKLGFWSSVKFLYLKCPHLNSNTLNCVSSGTDWAFGGKLVLGVGRCRVWCPRVRCHRSHFRCLMARENCSGGSRPCRNSVQHGNEVLGNKGLIASSSKVFQACLEVLRLWVQSVWDSTPSGRTHTNLKQWKWYNDWFKSSVSTWSIRAVLLLGVKASIHAGGRAPV